jgi:acrylyl-CoA reductase (NADPH)
VFDALVLDRQDGEQIAEIRTLEETDLPAVDGDETLVDVLYSSLNYKDALAVTGEGKIIRGDFPIAPGIDLVGRVGSTESDRFEAGDFVIGTGWQLGEVVWGGYTQRLRVDAAKLVPLPDAMTPHQAMVVGTAGFTAMLAVMALEDHGTTPADGDIVVTGASGGAGSIAVALLDALDFSAVASTGSEDAHPYLQALGASEIVDRSAFEDGPERPMERGRWAGAIDAVGGNTLAAIIAQLQRHASVAAFGNAGGHEVHTTVFPFILRGVNLLGIDSNTCPNDRRTAAWNHLTDLLDADTLDAMTARTIGLRDLPAASADVLSGSVRGRIVVDLSA